MRNKKGYKKTRYIKLNGINWEQYFKNNLNKMFNAWSEYCFNAYKDSFN